jgi:hypothetical protein
LIPNSEGLDEWGKLYLHFQFLTLMIKRFTKSVRQKKKKVYTFIHKQKIHGHHNENNNINNYSYENEFCVKGCSEEKS